MGEGKTGRGGQHWIRFLRRLLGLILLVYLVDLNSTHVRDFVRRLVTSWGVAQTLHEMGAIAGALDAEYASTRQYRPRTKCRASCGAGSRAYGARSGASPLPRRAGFTSARRARDAERGAESAAFRPTKGRDPAFDRWGLEYRIDLHQDGYVLTSCGPDVMCGTADDIRREGGSPRRD